jgi:hypothetical protein
VGTAVVDVQTGEVTRYSAAETPSWVDRIQPENFIVDQVNDRGEYSHGWWNPSKQDVLQVSSIDLVYDVKGRADYYVGLTSISSDKGLVGFLLIDSRTKEIRRFNVSGATEDIAELAAEKVFPEKHYEATNALPFMLNGEPTYVMALRDAATGIARSYGMVSLRNYQVVAVADTLQAAERLYASKLSMDRTSVESSTVAERRAVPGVVQRIAAEVHSGNTMYYVTLDGSGRIYVGASDISEELVLTKPGDKVTIEVDKGTARVTNMASFNNLDIPDAFKQ